MKICMKDKKNPALLLLFSFERPRKGSFKSDERLD